MAKNYLSSMDEVESPNHSSRMGNKPRMIVLHYTADTGRRAINWFRMKYWTDPKTGKERKVNASSHYVIARDGQITQMVALNRTAWHAGQRGARGVAIRPNKSSVGIEIVNAGEVPGGETYYGEKITNTVEIGGRTWQTYTRSQMVAVVQLVSWLCKELDIPRRFFFEGQRGCQLDKWYDTVPYYVSSGSRMAIWRFAGTKGVLGHCHISNGKDDPGPAFTLWKNAFGVK